MKSVYCSKDTLSQKAQTIFRKSRNLCKIPENPQIQKFPPKLLKIPEIIKNLEMPTKLPQNFIVSPKLC
jgi:hypothetical protein